VEGLAMNLVERLKQRRKEAIIIMPMDLSSGAVTAEETTRIVMLNAAMNYRNHVDGIIEGMSIEEMMNYLGVSSANSEGFYWLKTHIDDFIIQKDERYYHFHRTDIGTPLSIQEGTVAIQNPARVIDDEHYEHPFVFSDNRICYGSMSWVDEHGVRFKERNPIQDMAQISRMMATTLRVGKRVLERGYSISSENINPVHQLSEFPYIAKTRFWARRYARKHKIPYERIIGNNAQR